jgi:hypothetical protein
MFFLKAPGVMPNSFRRCQGFACRNRRARPCLFLPIDGHEGDAEILFLGLNLASTRSRIPSLEADIRWAERELAAQTARIGASVAELYPKFTLGGSIGLETLKTSTFMDAESRRYAIVPGGGAAGPSSIRVPYATTSRCRRPSRSSGCCL